MEYLASLQAQSWLSAILVTTPQIVALTGAILPEPPVVGLVENMSGYACSCCGEVTNVCSTGGGEAMAQREKIPFLGSLPVDTACGVIGQWKGSRGGRQSGRSQRGHGTKEGNAVEKAGFTVPNTVQMPSMTEKVVDLAAVTPASQPQHLKSTHSPLHRYDHRKSGSNVSDLHICAELVQTIS